MLEKAFQIKTKIMDLTSFFIEFVVKTKVKIIGPFIVEHFT
jgi:hypothetical protein